MMDHLSSGLMSFGVVEQIRQHRDVMASMLTLEGATNFKLTSDMMLDNLTVEFSPEGSNKKLPEINIHKYYCDYIQEIETREGKKQQKLCHYIQALEVWDNLRIATELFFFIDVDNGLSKLYHFITGSKTVTPLGAEKHITLKFKHECPAQCKCRPTAATCDPSITFPMHYNDTKDFEQALDTALEEYSGFGLV